MTYLFTDFDGVINAFTTKSQLNKHASRLELFGYVRKTTIMSAFGTYDIVYSAELIRKLNELHAKHKYTWLHLTTWVDEAVTVLNPRLNMNSDGSIIWDPHSGVNDHNYLEVRAERKYAALKETYNGRPFVWIDDEATYLFDAADFGDTPHLVIATDPELGLTKAEFETVEKFMEENN